MDQKAMQVGILVLLTVGLVVLIVQDKDVGPYAALLGPSVAALLVVQRVEKRSDQQDQVLEEIHQDTHSVQPPTPAQAVPPTAPQHRQGPVG